jgi:hypothetical protein
MLVTRRRRHSVSSATCITCDLREIDYRRDFPFEPVGFCNGNRFRSPRSARSHSREAGGIGIGGSLTAPPVPHHRTCGSAYGGSVTLSPSGPEVRVAFRQWPLRRFQVPFGLHPIRPWQAPPKRIGWRMTAMRAAHYYSRSGFGPSFVSGLRCPLLTSAARSRHLAMLSVTNPRHAADLPR